MQPWCLTYFSGIAKVEMHRSLLVTNLSDQYLSAGTDDCNTARISDAEAAPTSATSAPNNRSWIANIAAVHETSGDPIVQSLRGFNNRADDAASHRLIFQ